MTDSTQRGYVVFQAGRRFLVRPGTQVFESGETFFIENRTNGSIEPFFPSGIVTPEPAGQIGPGSTGQFTAGRPAPEAYPFAVYVEATGRRDFAEGESTPWIIIR